MNDPHVWLLRDIALYLVTVWAGAVGGALLLTALDPWWQRLKRRARLDCGRLGRPQERPGATVSGDY
jgi:hypothetical protein